GPATLGERRLCAAWRRRFSAVRLYCVSSRLRRARSISVSCAAKLNSLKGSLACLCDLPAFDGFKMATRGGVRPCCRAVPQPDRTSLAGSPSRRLDDSKASNVKLWFHHNGTNRSQQMNSKTPRRKLCAFT